MNESTRIKLTQTPKQLETIDVVFWLSIFLKLKSTKQYQDTWYNNITQLFSQL